MTYTAKKNLGIGLLAITIFGCGFGSGFMMHSITGSSSRQNAPVRSSGMSGFQPGQDPNSDADSSDKGFTIGGQPDSGLPFSEEDSQSGATEQQEGSFSAGNEGAQPGAGRRQSLYDLLDDEQKARLMELSGLDEEQLQSMTMHDLLESAEELPEDFLNEIQSSRPSRQRRQAADGNQNAPGSQSSDSGNGFTIGA